MKRAVKAATLFTLGATAGALIGTPGAHAESNGTQPLKSPTQVAPIVSFGTDALQSAQQGILQAELEKAQILEDARNKQALKVAEEEQERLQAEVDQKEKELKRIQAEMEENQRLLAAKKIVAEKGQKSVQTTQEDAGPVQTTQEEVEPEQTVQKKQVAVDPKQMLLTEQDKRDPKQTLLTEQDEREPVHAVETAQTAQTVQKEVKSAQTTQEEEEKKQVTGQTGYVDTAQEKEERLQAARYAKRDEINNAADIGKLSEKYESKGNPGQISNTLGDYGGKSYGIPQFSVVTKSLHSFVKSLQGTDIGDRLAKHEAGSDAFDAEWKKIAAEDPEGFAKIQNDYTKPNFYTPAVQKIKQKTGLNVEEYSYVLKSVVWSTAVQHGSGGAALVFKNAGVTHGMSEEEIIKRIYKERGANKGGKYFYSSSERVQLAVYNRFTNEALDALKMYRKLVAEIRSVSVQ